jgi:hypothetical protein
MPSEIAVFSHQRKANTVRNIQQNRPSYADRQKSELTLSPFRAIYCGVAGSTGSLAASHKDNREEQDNRCQVVRQCACVWSNVLITIAERSSKQT